MIKSWSFTKLEHYLACPRKFKLEDVDQLCPKCFKGRVEGYEVKKCDTCGHIVRMPEPVERGIRLHSAIEAYLLGRAGLVAELENSKTVLAGMKRRVAKGYVRVEFPLVLDASWSPVDKYTKGAWFRGKADVLEVPGEVLHVTDWKSGGVDRAGKIRDNLLYLEQIELYGITALLHFPATERALARLWFLDAHPSKMDVSAAPVERKDVPKLIKKWQRKIRPMFNDKKCAPLPSYKCQWCPFAKGIGGPCPY